MHTLQLVGSAMADVALRVAAGKVRSDEELRTAIYGGVEWPHNIEFVSTDVRAARAAHLIANSDELIVPPACERNIVLPRCSSVPNGCQQADELNKPHARAAWALWQ